MLGGEGEFQGGVRVAVPAEVAGEEVESVQQLPVLLLEALVGGGQFGGVFLLLLQDVHLDVPVPHPLLQLPYHLL